MSRWWQTKKAAWGETIMSLAIGGFSTYLKPIIGIPIFIVMAGIGIWLLIKAYRSEKKMGEIKSELKIGTGSVHVLKARDYDEAFGGRLQGESRMVTDIILSPSKPMVIQTLSLELWGKHYDAMLTRQVAPFDLIPWTPVTLSETQTFLASFDIPPKTAIDTQDAQIYALTTDGREYHSLPFTITFGGTNDQS
jgi:hypothetical protein